MSAEKTFAVPDKLTIAQAQQVHSQLHELLACAKSQSIIIDCDNLSRIDAAGVQLLVAFQKDATRLHIELQWQNANSTLSNSLDTLGLQNILNLQPVKH